MLRLTQHERFGVLAYTLQALPRRVQTVDINAEHIQDSTDGFIHHRG